MNFPLSGQSSDEYASAWYLDFLTCEYTRLQRPQPVNAYFVSTRLTCFILEMAVCQLHRLVSSMVLPISGDGGYPNANAPHCCGRQ
jgi:hypothetical protein